MNRYRVIIAPVLLLSLVSVPRAALFQLPEKTVLRQEVKDPAVWANMYDWTDSPIVSAVPGLVPVLVKGYSVLSASGDAVVERVGYGRYLPRQARYPGFEGLDLLRGRGPLDSSLTIIFNRPAVVYLLLQGREDRERLEDPSLSGWKTEVSTEIDANDTLRTELADLGIRIPNKGWVFSQTVTEGHLTIDDIDNLVPTGFTSLSNYALMFAEEDGTPSTAPILPSGIVAEPNTPCPGELHDLQTVNDSDGVTWETYHPLVDPVYWCYYSHEHGSYPGRKMKYMPTFDRTSRFNNEEDESNAGFKGYMFTIGEQVLYHTMHAHLSRVSRFHTRFHTTTYAVTNAAGELQADMSCKTDFGPALVRGKELIRRLGRRIRLGPEDEKIPESDEDLLEATHGASRLFNVVMNPPGEQDPRVDLHEEDPLRSRYEQWSFNPPCSRRSESTRRALIKADIRDPQTGKQTVDGDASETMFEFEGRNGLSRDFQTQATVMADEECVFENGNLDDFRSSGSPYFYTDPFCRELKEGPCDTCVKQMMVEGFRLEISEDIAGPNDVLNQWTIEYGKREEGASVTKVPNIDLSVVNLAN